MLRETMIQEIIDMKLKGYLGSAKKPAIPWYYWTKRAICGMLNL